MENMKKRELEELIRNKKWTKFLNAIPLDKEQKFKVADANDLASISASAGRLNSMDGCDRRISLKMDYEAKCFRVLAITKQNEHETTAPIT